MRGDLRPLRITATLATPVITYGDGLTLDGLLAYCAWREWPSRWTIPPWDPEAASRYADRVSLPPPSSDAVVRFGLPLERRVLEDGTWWWCASWPDARWIVETTAAVRRPAPSAIMIRRTRERTLSMGSGPFRGVDLRLPARVAREIHWYCRGHAASIGRVLRRHIRHLGKRAGAGTGRVLEWRVEPWDTDWSEIRDGMVMRTLPVDWAEERGADGVLDRKPLCPPYWRGQDAVAVLRPLDPLSEAVGR